MFALVVIKILFLLRIPFSSFFFNGVPVISFVQPLFPGESGVDQLVEIIKVYFR